MFISAREIEIIFRSYFSEYSHRIFLAVQRRSAKIMFHRKTHVAELYCNLSYWLRLQLYYNMTSSRLFSCEFMPDYSRKAASLLSLFKLLLSKKSKFSSIFPLTICTITHIYEPFTPLILVLFMQVFLLLENILEPFFINVEIHLILLRIYIYFFFMNLHVGRIAEQTCSLFLK